jgi:anti-sigma regulatory factor (Ser/Thr protein kinase)
MLMPNQTLLFDDNPSEASTFATWLNATPTSQPEVLAEQLQHHPPQVLIADVHSFLRYRLVYPAPTCPIVWMTASPISGLLRLAIAHKVTTIVPRQLPLNKDFWHMVQTGCAQGVMPLDALIASGARRMNWIIQNSTDIMVGFHQMRAFFEAGNARALDDLSTVYMEAVSNAVYHAVKSPDGHDLYPKGSYIEALPPEAWVHVTLWQDAEKAGLHVKDHGGTVKLDETLYWLDRHTRGAGMLDVHGRGFYLMRLLTDGFVLNVNPGHGTDLAAWQYHHPTAHINKPLLLLQQSA